MWSKNQGFFTKLYHLVSSTSHIHLTIISPLAQNNISKRLYLLANIHTFTLHLVYAEKINCDNSYFLFNSHGFLYFLVCEDLNIKESLLLVFFQITALPRLNLPATTSHTATKK